MALSKIDVANMLTGLVPNDNTIRRPLSKPIIINGDMTIAQRDTSATGKTSSGYYTCDRIQFVANDAGTHTVIQETSTSGNAYINGSVGIGTDSPSEKLTIKGNFSAGFSCGHRNPSSEICMNLFINVMNNNHTSFPHIKHHVY